MTADMSITVNASNSGWNFFSTWNGKPITEPAGSGGIPTYIKQAGGWVQASLVYTQANGTTPYYTISTGGTGMTWDAVDFLLQHLGFTTATKHPEYVTYEYQGDARYGLSLHHASQWTDMQVREIMAYAYKVLGHYEEDKHSVASPPREIPLSEFEVEDW